MPGTGYLENGDIDEDMAKLRKSREDLWMKTFRTIYPYGLNEKAFDKNSDSKGIQFAIGKLYPRLERLKPRPVSVRNHNKSIQSQPINSTELFFQHIDTMFSNSLKSLSNNIRILVNKLPKKLLFQIASEIMHPEIFATDPLKEQIYLYVLDLIDTRFFSKTEKSERSQKSAPKNVCVIPFINKIVRK